MVGKDPRHPLPLEEEEHCSAWAYLVENHAVILVESLSGIAAVEKYAGE